MKIPKSLEQTIYVLLMLALQKGHTPVKSHVLSHILGVSDSYLKKILMTLTKAGLVTSNASKLGGYQLAKSIEDISLADVMKAIDGAKEIQFNHLSKAIFEDEEHVLEGEDKIKSSLVLGFTAFYESLEQLKLADLLHRYAYQEGYIDWNERMSSF
ncbi:RrF2 family transcriptional regulator [Streptococcus sp. zg-JUN1979]|uniref:RrF2 family transcriptional regulator n=1 Tax=Streptococcus sp. zg-JUN1979 TaxID=3391450 RepID=UPI0039A64153